MRDYRKSQDKRLTDQETTQREKNGRHGVFRVDHRWSKTKVVRRKYEGVGFDFQKIHTKEKGLRVSVRQNGLRKGDVPHTQW